MRPVVKNAFPPVACAVLAGAFLLALAGCATTPADIGRLAAPGDDNAVAQVAPYLQSNNTLVRRAAIAALVQMPNNYAAMDALTNATLSPDPAVRGDVGAAIVFYPHPDVDFYALTLIADPDPGVRRRLAEGLATGGRAGSYEQTRQAGVYLWGLMQDSDPTVRAAAAQGLGELGLNDPITFSLDALRHDSDPRVRAAAARGLGALARAYLSGQPGPASHDQQVSAFLAAAAGLQRPTDTQARGEEIVGALCVTASTDAGEYEDVRITTTWFSRQRVVERHFVALEAADALTVAGQTPRADVAAAQAAARVRAAAVLARLPASVTLAPNARLLLRQVHRPE
jgi:HEAT repeat protein